VENAHQNRRLNIFKFLFHSVLSISTERVVQLPRLFVVELTVRQLPPNNS
jgi:hypothetical protein